MPGGCQPERPQLISSPVTDRKVGGEGGARTFMLLSPSLLGTLHSSTLSVMWDWWWLGGGGFFTLL